MKNLVIICAVCLLSGLILTLSAKVLSVSALSYIGYACYGIVLLLGIYILNKKK